MKALTATISYEEKKIAIHQQSLGIDTDIVRN